MIFKVDSRKERYTVTITRTEITFSFFFWNCPPKKGISFEIPFFLSIKEKFWSYCKLNFFQVWFKETRVYYSHNENRNNFFILLLKLSPGKKESLSRFLFSFLLIFFYSKKIFCRRHSSIISSGQTETWTSPICAFSKKSIQSRDCPIPPPTVKGSVPSATALWYG